MNVPSDRDTPPPDFGVEQSDRDELAETEQGAYRNGNGDGHDMQELIDAFLRLPMAEQTKRLLHLYLAIQGEDGLTRKDLANHKFEDRQEFAVINDELDYHANCFELLMKHFDIEAPPRPKERPRRRE